MGSEPAHDPQFARLVEARQRVRFALTGLLVALYVGFALAALYAPDWFAAPIADGSVIGIGLVLAYAIIVLTIVLAGVYVHWANTRFEAQERRLSRRPVPPG